jgi:DNA-binding transcriptional regulator YiaG
MTPTEVRTAREFLELTQGQAARLFGVDERTWRGWEGERSAIPPTAALLLRACMALPGVRRWLERQAGRR